MSNAAVPATLQDAIRYFADLDRCTEILAASRWPDGVRCPTCGNAKLTFIKARRIWQCNVGHRDIGVTQKTAWFMDHRIRLAMQSGTFEKVARKFEADESFIGGLARNMHKDKKA